MYKKDRRERGEKRKTGGRGETKGVQRKTGGRGETKGVQRKPGERGEGGQPFCACPRGQCPRPWRGFPSSGCYCCSDFARGSSHAGSDCSCSDWKTVNSSPQTTK